MAAGIRAAGGAARAIRADVASIAEMRALARAAVDARGAIDVMVINAGIMPLAFYAGRARTRPGEAHRLASGHGSSR